MKLVCMVMGLLIVPTAVHAQLVPLTQGRGGSGLAHIDQILFEPLDITDSFTAVTDVAGPYSVMDSAEARYQGAVRSYVRLNHTSLISSNQISFDSTLTGGHPQLPSGSLVNGAGNHGFRSQFRVDEPTDFSLSASVVDNSGCVFEVRFFREGGGIFHLIEGSGARSFTDSGTLQPGTYVFEAFAFGFEFATPGGGPPPAEMSNRLMGSLVVPAPASGAIVLGLGVGALRRRRR